MKYFKRLLKSVGLAYVLTSLLLIALDNAAAVFNFHPIAILVRLTDPVLLVVAAIIFGLFSLGRNEKEDNNE